MTKTKTILSIATELQSQLQTSERNNGAKYVHFKDGAPEWMTEFSHAVHGNKMPDDYVYKFIDKAIDAIVGAEAENEDAAGEAIDEIEPDIYTADLMDWVAGNYEFCEQAIEEGLWESNSKSPDFVSLLSVGQAIHIREVGHSVVNELEKLAE